MRMGDDRTPKEEYLRSFTYSGPEISVIDAKGVLSEYSDPDGAGSVDLEKDASGIAKICLNNPGIRNAMNGKILK